METTQYKQRLTEEKTRLEHELANLGRPNPSNPNDWEVMQTDVEQESDPSDRAEKLESYVESGSILSDLEVRYASVKKALERIEAGTYGTCGVCGKEIESGRLDVDPAAETCMEHKG